MCWMLRIAKHLDGLTREMVISKIHRSIDDLESALASEMHVRDDVRAA